MLHILAFLHVETQHGPANLDGDVAGVEQHGPFDPDQRAKFTRVILDLVTIMLERYDRMTPGHTDVADAYVGVRSTSQFDNVFIFAQADDVDAP